MINWEVVLILVVAALAGYAIYRTYLKGDVVTVSGIAGSLEAAVPIGKEVVDVAQTVVNAIEQERRQPGSPITDSEAFSRATSEVRGWLNALGIDGAEVTDQQILTAVNSAILVASSLSHQIKADKATVGEAAQKGVVVDASK